MGKIKKTLIGLAILAIILPVAPMAFAASGGAKPLVCIDPGHGGSDQGAVANGLEEKEINLDVAHRTRPLLEGMGYRVIMTRETDVYVSLQERCDIANRAGATIFVSIHNNAYVSTAHGTETFCYYNSHEGRRLATFIQNELLVRLGRADRGVQEAGFYVLKHTDMTAALLEGAFLTNVEEAELLETDDFRQKMAAAAAAGINNYFLDPGTKKFTFKGRGRGHGVGLCMDGVYYRAMDGQSYRDIISHYYTGIDFGKTDDGQPIRVKCLDGQIRTYTLKNYLYHLAEEPETYPFEGLKVLYVAARTYTLSCIARGKHHAEGFDICSSGGCCQAFDENKDISKYPNNCAAVDATSGEIITYQEEPIIAAYHGSCGGHTENNEDVWGGDPRPYLRGKPCGYCHLSSRYEWTVEMTRSEVEARLNQGEDTQVGSLFSMDLSSRTPGGRVKKAVLVGSLGSKTVSGSTLAGRLGFQSSLFELSESIYASTFYFAEGYTADNFQEYLCLGNPHNAAVTVEVNYMFKDGTTMDKSYTIPVNSRLTVNVNQVVGKKKEVSIRVRSQTANLVAERPMYFNYKGKWTGGHDAVGAVAPSRTWYFAEGTTREGFEQYITVQNPGLKPASITFRYMIEGQGEITYSEDVGASSRATFSPLDHVGWGKDISLLLESDQDVVAERPMYFNYQGLDSQHNWQGGHCVAGTNSSAREWYFAEGTTRGGFEEWLCIQNPNSKAIQVNARYMVGEGQGVSIDKSYKVPAKQRLTVSVNQEVGPEKDVSVRLTSDSGFIAERPMYFNYHSAWDGGHDVMGARGAANTWFLAEGYTGKGFDEWICIQNPGAADANVKITCYPESGSLIETSHIVRADSRYTIPVNSDVGANLSISTTIQSDQPIICERPMYFAYNGIWTGGHDVVGFAPGQ